MAVAAVTAVTAIAAVSRRRVVRILLAFGAAGPGAGTGEYARHERADEGLYVRIARRRGGFLKQAGEVREYIRV